LLDKDDEEEGALDEKAKNSTVKIKEQANEEGDEDEEEGENQGDDNDDEDYIDEEEMLDVAERCFVRIA
jgi:hypothetical protein